MRIVVVSKSVHFESSLTRKDANQRLQWRSFLPHSLPASTTNNPNAFLLLGLVLPRFLLVVSV